MLITAEKLNDLVGGQDLVVFDCRFQLGHPEAGREAYLAGHIPGGVYLDLERDLSGPPGEHGGRHPLPDPKTLAGKLGGSGVGETTQVVVYDDNQGMAPRAWWLIRYLGHERVAVLDGGFSAWQQADYPVSQELPAPRAQTFPLAVRSDWVVPTSDVEDMVRARQGLLIDARASDRYRGDVEPLDRVAGHIPGAINLPWTDGIGPDGLWKSQDEQRLRFAAATGRNAMAAGQDVVMYCGSGVTACANLLALELAGVKGARLYAGSWSDWCSYDEHPVAQGNDP